MCLSEEIILRKKSRENAFLIVFEKCFNDSSTDEIVELAGENRELDIDDFALSLINGVEDNLEAVDAMFEPYLKNWKKSRLSKTALTVLRIACYEIGYLDDIPIGVSINEAVELSKKFGSPEEAKLVNGILGSVSRNTAAKAD